MAAKPDFSFLRRPHAMALSVVLLCLAALAPVLTPPEKVAENRPLRDIPTTIGAWTRLQEGVVDAETEALLKADDTLSRSYFNTSNRQVADLFVAFFKTQRAGAMPHSPKICLPAAGWIPTESSVMPIAIPGMAEPISVNRYVIARGDEKSLVLYWYQTPRRVIANEYTAKFYTIVDGVRYHRSDTSLIRIVVPIMTTEAAAEASAVQFTQTIFTLIRHFLPA
jgi:EpsI family protein